MDAGHTFIDLGLPSGLSCQTENYLKSFGFFVERRLRKATKNERIEVTHIQWPKQKQTADGYAYENGNGSEDDYE